MFDRAVSVNFCFNGGEENKDLWSSDKVGVSHSWLGRDVFPFRVLTSRSRDWDTLFGVKVIIANWTYKGRILHWLCDYR